MKGIKEMRRDGIPYVQNPKHYYPPVDINKLSLEEIRQKYIKTCGKANGNISVCSKCATPCTEGKRAIQLLANEVYSDPPVPLYGGKTLIERAKEENMKRRAAEAEQAANVLVAEEEKEKVEAPRKKKYQRLEGWWEESLASGDQVQWLMEKMNISKNQAQKKIYAYRYHHGLTNQNVTGPTIKTEEKPVEIVEESKPVEHVTKHPNDVVFKTMESKIDDLMKLQTEYKKKMDEYKAKYEAVSEQIDVLCKAMDVFDITNG